MKLIVTYNEIEIVTISPATDKVYSSDRIIMGEILEIRDALTKLNVDVTALYNYEYPATNLMYVIVPTELSSVIRDMLPLVQDVLPDMQFTVYLSTEQITTRDGVTRNMKTKPINFSVCSIITWADGDEDLLNYVISTWNGMNSDRRITFSCKFDTLNDLEVFKSYNS